ncbi:MAG: hypothetical protein RIS26_44 [Actinomycetota bacterium]|jgi:UDP-N-acetylmuramyl tripeptide synthase
MIPLAVLLGKAARFVLRLRGGGSAIPGRVAMMVSPKFLEKTLGSLDRGIYFVSGSNGKSTTTSMLVRILREHGLRVLSNPAGGNLPQGLASALLAEVSWNGKLNHDVAILEVDEAYGKLIAARVAPNGLLLTNLQLDQLNRFHSPEDVFTYLEDLANLTTHLLVVNGSDPNTERLAKSQTDRLEVAGVYTGDAILKNSAHGLLAAPNFSVDNTNLPSVCELISTSRDSASLKLKQGEFEVKLPAPGLHYAVDAALAAGMASKILGDDLSPKSLVAAFVEMVPVYGRGERIEYQGQTIEIIMMKNYPSLQANLDALQKQPECVWISVDEGTPDPSWIYDIDLGLLQHADVISGTKTFQWATRLAYQGLPYGELIEDEEAALKYFLDLPGTQKTAVINYEQMMWLRKRLGLLDIEGTDA